MLIHKHPDQSVSRALEIWTQHYSFIRDASQQQRINRKAIVIIFRGPLVTSEKGRKPFLNPSPYMERFHSWWKMSACKKGLWLKCTDIIWVCYSVLLQPVSTVLQQGSWRKFTGIGRCWIQSSASLTSSCSELNLERDR